MFDLILVVVAMFIVVGVLELKQRYTTKAIQQPKEEPVQAATAQDLNKRKLNEDFIERALWIAGHAASGAEVYQEGGSIVVKYPDGAGHKVSLFSHSKLRQPKRRYARDLVKSNGHKPAPKPDYPEEPAEFAAAWN